MCKQCENCGTVENVSETDIGVLCETCYGILLLEQFNILEEDNNTSEEI